MESQNLTFRILTEYNKQVCYLVFEARRSRRDRANKAKSANLDDLDSLLTTISSTSTPKLRRKKRDEASTFDLFTKEGAYADCVSWSIQKKNCIKSMLLMKCFCVIVNCCKIL